MWEWLKHASEHKEQKKYVELITQKIFVESIKEYVDKMGTRFNLYFFTYSSYEVMLERF